MKWSNIYDIAFSLEEAYPETDVINLSFTKLKNLVISLKDFNDDANSSNEKILEAIQMAWLEERK